MLLLVAAVLPSCAELAQFLPAKIHWCSTIVSHCGENWTALVQWSHFHSSSDFPLVSFAGKLYRAP
jgi:hypothetical protein